LRSSSSACGSGAACAIRTGSASFTSAELNSTSSGKAITTGPGRPDIATRYALAMISGMRSILSISVTHFAMPPNICR
jgi:BioD-like phosphotransacetylase family protein